MSTDSSLKLSERILTICVIRQVDWRGLVRVGKVSHNQLIASR